MARLDPHSYNDDTQVETASIAWYATIDFATRTINASVLLRFKEPGSGTLDLDTRGLVIDEIEDTQGVPLEFTLHPEEPTLGARLEVTLPDDTEAINIRYQTTPDASALQWLEPAQTAGKQHPFLFSQCQAVHARSIIPLQDTPRLRITFHAELDVPKPLRAVMAAAPGESQEFEDRTRERFDMPQPIPPYLIAFAVGDLASRDLSPRSRVWAEPSVLDAAAHEFATVEDMMQAAEQLFGPYDWERFDLLTMPPSFPYGGMENPRLTFATPTVIAGDRSLVALVAHELAHSWTGNLVTNANAEHFWLNEGFTVYAERRIVEALYGAEIAALDAALGRRDLLAAIARFADRPQLTRLRTQLQGIDADDAYSQVPYEKGAAFLELLDATVGRPAFDAWLKRYLETFRFGAITTDDFTAHFEAAFPGTLAAVGASEWIDGEGLPANAPRAQSERLAAIEALAGAPPSQELGAKWNATEWVLYLESVPRPATHEHCALLERDFHLSDSKNYEILVAWLKLALESGYTSVVPRVDEVLSTVGRMKFVRPLFQALIANPATKDHARTLFERVKSTYHPIARGGVAAMFAR